MRMWPIIFGISFPHLPLRRIEVGLPFDSADEGLADHSWSDRMKRLIASSSALFLLLAAIAPLRADGPVSTLNGGIRGTVVEGSRTHQVEWANTTLHKLKFSFTLTLDDGSTATGSATLGSNQKIQDSSTVQKLHRVTRIQIGHIEIMD